MLYQEVSNRQGEGVTHSNIGLAYQKLGNYPQALVYYQQALEIFREIGNSPEERLLQRVNEGTTLNNIGLTYDLLGDYPQALVYYQQALEIRREISDSPEERLLQSEGEGITLTSIGLTYYRLGDYPQALAYSQQALGIFRKLGNRSLTGTTLNNIGGIYGSLGDYPQALVYYQQAMEIRREVSDRAGEGATLNNIGLTYRNLGDYAQALDNYQQSIGISREIGDREGEGTTLNNIGLTYRNLGDYAQALDYYQQSIGISREIGDREGEGTTLNNIGGTYEKLGDYPQAVAYYRQSLGISRDIGDREGEGRTLNNIGWALFQKGEFSDAEYQLSEAVKILDELRNIALPPEDRISLFETQQGTYQILQETLVAQHKIEQALAVSEQGRARVLAEQITSTNLDAVLTTIPNLDQIRRIAQAQNATLISYSIIPDKDPLLYIWVVSPNGAIDFKQVPLSSTDDINSNTVASLIQPDSSFYRGTPTTLGIGRGIGLEFDPAETSDRLYELHQLLIDPIQDYLPTDPNEKVIFIPQDGLFMVPFPALQDQDETYLIEKHTILTAPSIQVLGLTPQLKNGASNDFSTPLVVGNPTMPLVWNPDTGNEEQLSTLKGAEQEAIDIATLFNTQALTGRQATEAMVKQQMSLAELIHFATHGLLEYGNPQDSGVLDVPGAIALAPGNGEDGLLTSAELLEMDLNADLVVLSACDTGRGRVTGDGVIGLSRSLITAGVPSIVVSLWSVPDTPTASLMTDFYSNMQQGMDKAQSLRQAMLTMIEDKRHPRDWAAFTLIGESD